MPMKMEQIECSETSAYINQTPGNYPKENTISLTCFEQIIVHYQDFIIDLYQLYRVSDQTPHKDE